MDMDHIRARMEKKLNSLRVLNKMESKKHALKDRSSLCKQFNTDCVSHEHDQIYVFGNERCSKKPLNTLSPIKLDDMMAPNVHSGSYLLCRTVSKATACILVLIEDMDGNVEILQMQNLVKSSDLNEFMPEGTLLIIKEPCLKYGLYFSMPYICCDSPSDVIVIDEHNCLLIDTHWFKRYDRADFDGFKVNGGHFYRIGKYESALRSYRKALSIVQNDAVIHANMSAVLFKLERYKESYEHAECSYELMHTDKALYRMGQSAYELRKWKLAIDKFKLVEDASVTIGKIAQCDQRLDEAANANYDWLTMYTTSQNSQKTTRLHVADYVGPVKVVDIDGKGRGLVATRNVKPGELLLVSKAFSSAYISECGAMCSSYNTVTNQLSTPSEYLNMRNAMINLKNNCESAMDLYGLYCGNGSSGNGKLDASIVDVDRIEKICLFNAFIGDSVAENNLIGLWLYQSLINHSCYANAYRTFYADIMVVRSIKFICKDDEVTFEYIDVSLPLTERVRQLHDCYQFMCDCGLCKTDKADVEYQKREVLLDKLRDGPCMSLDEILGFVINLRISFKNRTAMRFQLIYPLTILVAQYRSHRKYTEAIRTYEEIFRICDGTMEATAITTLYMIANAYYAMNDLALARQNLLQAVHKSKVVHGDCPLSFKMRFKYLDQADELFKLI
jgi:tetratricopeptide (TPR) repeat protein